MKSFSNTYIFVFSTVMVIIVAILLSFVSEQLKPIQEKNIEVEKKLDILRSVGEAKKIGETKNKNTYVEEEYDKYITDSYVIHSSGDTVEGADAFTVNLKYELSRPLEERNLPVFIYTGEQGSHKYIFPVRGKGLWGPIWGYVALNEDFNTVYGAIFAHEKETPGLGAEINQPWFQSQFVGKTLFDKNGNFVSIEVEKGGADPADPHAVDAVSGGTITSKALEAMLKVCLGGYETYFKNKTEQQ